MRELAGHNTLGVTAQRERWGFPPRKTLHPTLPTISCFMEPTFLTAPTKPARISGVCKFYPLENRKNLFTEINWSFWKWRNLEGFSPSLIFSSYALGATGYFIMSTSFSLYLLSLWNTAKKGENLSKKPGRIRKISPFSFWKNKTKKKKIWQPCKTITSNKIWMSSQVRHIGLSYQSQKESVVAPALWKNTFHRFRTTNNPKIAPAIFLHDLYWI